MLVRVGCEFRHTTAAPVPSLWQVRPRLSGRHRTCVERWEPPAPASVYLDSYGNECDRLVMPEGPSVLRYDATLEVPAEADEVDESAVQSAIEDLPDEAFLFLLPSHLCAPEPIYDQAWELFGDLAPGYRRVESISDWVHQNVSYEVGASCATTTAADVFTARTGVCRDFTQLGITLCRALNVPARYVAGYLPDIGVEPPDLAMDFCSWFEAWLGGQWWTFDPRNAEPRIGRVVVAYGRDASDTAMVTTWGKATLEQMTVWADEVKDAG
jgi:transglutaminase-like putative cysteine protease